MARAGGGTQGANGRLRDGLRCVPNIVRSRRGLGPRGNANHLRSRLAFAALLPPAGYAAPGLAVRSNARIAAAGKRPQIAANTSARVPAPTPAASNFRK